MPPRLTVACLCAAWCSSCRAYRSTFDRVAGDFPAQRFVWIDIEERATLVDSIDVENFPTLLIASGRQALFFGTLTPQPEVLARLIRAHSLGEAASPLADPRLSPLLEALAAIGPDPE